MSSLTTLARPYAKAAFSLAQEARALDAWQSMLSLASQIATDPAVAAVLKNPLVSADQAISLFSSAAGDRFDERFGSFLGVLGANRRLPLLVEITALFSRFKQAAERRLQVRVVAARALEADQASRLGDALSRRFDCAIEIDTVIDPGLLGGAVVYAGDQVIDGSLRGRLDKLGNALSR
jgi:F-type H+-transporting ATPase subunit delta